ncbi:MAG: 23S rRNA (adenine(2503)-C(2))-methyltransferase RlmN, partial [Treponema sp.]|nr:23S rRNA (adenine(2503)-C(2))-methyltransferase RlmN [Treponema sp.]
KTAIAGLPFDELAARLAPLPRFRPAQIFRWIAAGITTFDEMSDLPLSLREELKGRFLLRESRVDKRLDGGDGTVKLAIGLAGGAMVEAVLLRDGRNRRTACLSTQAGCPAACVFCKTGSLGFLRNLTAAEIVEQFLFLREAAEREGQAIDNIVVMGMGEPLLNLAELRRALAVISAKEGMCFSKRRITVSTCGISGGITDIAGNGPDVRLALSLTTADEYLRRRLMPITAAYPLAGVKEALAYFQQKGGGRLTLEAALLGGVNTRSEDAAAFARFARGLDTVVNLIPWNPVKGLKFEGKDLREPTEREIEYFAARLEAQGLNVTRRFRKGRSVMGSCGQLGVLVGQ